MFSTSGGKHYSALVKDGECLVPWEVLCVPEFWVGVFGGERMTTSTTRVAVKPGVKTSAKPGMLPSPTAYEQLMSELCDGMTRVEEHAEAAVSAAAQTEENALVAERSAATADSAKDAVVNALNNVPAGGTVIVNDLTTGGTRAALSAEMGKTLNQNKIGKSDKPSGAYRGTGSAVTQTFNVGGIGKCVYIYGGSLAAIIGPNGGIAWNGNGRTMQTIATSEGTFQNGVLTISTDSYYLNSSSIPSYYYQVL